MEKKWKHFMKQFNLLTKQPLIFKDNETHPFWKNPGEGKENNEILNLF